MKAGKIASMLVAAGLILGVSTTGASAQHIRRSYNSGYQNNNGYQNNRYQPNRVVAPNVTITGGYNNTGYHPGHGHFVPHTYGGYNNTGHHFVGEGRMLQNNRYGTYRQDGRRNYR